MDKTTLRTSERSQQTSFVFVGEVIDFAHLTVRAQMPKGRRHLGTKGVHEVLRGAR